MASTVSYSGNQNPGPAELKELFKQTTTGDERKLPKQYSCYVFPQNKYDVVYPELLLGDKSLAKDVQDLKANKITHVLNTAQGKKFTQIDTDQAFYDPLGIKFHGFSAMDVAGCSLTEHFQGCADFIDDALNSGGRVFVHCHQGMSRSATITIAFLMMKRGMNVVDAALTVRRKRPVLPNDGFLKQLCSLNDKLYPRK